MQDEPGAPVVPASKDVLREQSNGGYQRDTGANCYKRVFLGSVLVYLAARNQRAKLTTKVVCMSPVSQLLWVCENHITNPPINPKSMSPTTSFI